MNAGDDFHELWVLRHALELLDSETDLKAVAVQGLVAEAKTGISEDTWDGVDCVFYYGNNLADRAESVVLEQVKYSSAGLFASLENVSAPVCGAEPFNKQGIGITIHENFA